MDNTGVDRLCYHHLVANEVGLVGVNYKHKLPNDVAYHRKTRQKVHFAKEQLVHVLNYWMGDDSL